MIAAVLPRLLLIMLLVKTSHSSRCTWFINIFSLYFSFFCINSSKNIQKYIIFFCILLMQPLSEQRTPAQKIVDVGRESCAQTNVDFESARKVMPGASDLSLRIFCGEIIHPDVQKFIKSTTPEGVNQEVCHSAFVTPYIRCIMLPLRPPFFPFSWINVFFAPSPFSWINRRYKN